jgi:hypothetical protein
MYLKNSLKLGMILYTPSNILLCMQPTQKKQTTSKLFFLNPMQEENKKQEIFTQQDQTPETLMKMQNFCMEVPHFRQNIRIDFQIEVQNFLQNISIYKDYTAYDNINEMFKITDTPNATAIEKTNSINEIINDFFGAAITSGKKDSIQEIICFAKDLKTKMMKENENIYFIEGFNFQNALLNMRMLNESIVGFNNFQKSFLQEIVQENTYLNNVKKCLETSQYNNKKKIQSLEYDILKLQENTELNVDIIIIFQNRIEKLFNVIKYIFVENFYKNYNITEFNVSELTNALAAFNVVGVGSYKPLDNYIYEALKNCISEIHKVLECIIKSHPEDIKDIKKCMEIINNEHNPLVIEKYLNSETENLQQKYINPNSTNSDFQAAHSDFKEEDNSDFKEEEKYNENEYLI